MPWGHIKFCREKGSVYKVAIYSSLLKVRTKQFSVRHRDDSARPTWNSNRVPAEWLDFTRENSPINSKCDRTLTTGLGTEPEVVRIAYMLIVKAAVLHAQPMGGLFMQEDFMSLMPFPDRTEWWKGPEKRGKCPIVLMRGRVCGGVHSLNSSGNCSCCNVEGNALQVIYY